MRDWRVALLRNLGYKPTKPNLEFLATWQRWEGGHTNNGARFNWLNTTKVAPGAVGSINSVGVKKFNSFKNGIGATVATLQNGRYQDILDALSSGDPYKFNPSAGLQTWVSGRPDGNPGYAQKVLGKGASVQRQRDHTAPNAPAPGSRQKADGSWDYAMGLIFEDDPEMVTLMQGLGDLGPTTPRAYGRAGAPDIGLEHRGKVIVPGTGWKGTHVSDGLGWGTATAEDIMADPGTPVGAPEESTVIYWHPTGAQGGGSMLLRTKSGREYWLGHIADGIKPGTRVKRGQVVAYVSSDHRAPHLHIDWRNT
jgi:murein DD-endopeptidase MepM/ murein hydrolase activator NlpD